MDLGRAEGKVKTSEELEKLRKKIIRKKRTSKALMGLLISFGCASVLSLNEKSYTTNDAQTIEQKEVTNTNLADKQEMHDRVLLLLAAIDFALAAASLGAKNKAGLLEMELEYEEKRLKEDNQQKSINLKKY